MASSPGEGRGLLRLLLPLALSAALVLPAVATAERLATTISAHVTEGQDAIFGEVRSKILACEKRREVRLFGPVLNAEEKTITKGGQEFQRYGIKLTNRFGEYRFNGMFDSDYGNPAKRGGGGGGFFAQGQYFTRALRKDFPRTVCRFDDSPQVQIFVD